MDHDQVTRRDGWNGRLYAAHAAHHRQKDDAFLATLPLCASDRVLDVGCGTGEFTSRLAERVPQGSVVGIDPSPSQIETARAHETDRVELICGRAEELEVL